jgi:hypothetical protein
MKNSSIAAAKKDNSCPGAGNTGESLRVHFFCCFATRVPWRKYRLYDTVADDDNDYTICLPQ